MRERLLVRHFLRRFLEHDLVSSNADRREVLSVAGGTLISISVFLSVLIALQYQFNNFLPPGLSSVRSLAERFFFVAASMLIMALLAVALWDGLALDERDAAVLGILPVPRTVIVRAKFLAVALLAVGTDVAWNLPSLLLRGVSLPLTLPVHGRSVLLLMAAHGAVTLAAGAFGFLSVLALREGLIAMCGRDWFQRISSTVQVVLIVPLTSALLLLPGGYTRAARTLLEARRLPRSAVPPLWFVGLHETLAGSVIDNLARTRPPRYLVTQELAATTFYRGLWPVYHDVGRLAMPALGVVALVAVLASAWNNRRLPAPVLRRRPRASAMQRAATWIVAYVVARTPIEQAGFWFTMQTLPRRPAHRTVLASALAIGMALIVISVGGGALDRQPDLSTVPLGILIAQPLLLASLVTGFRRAAQLPAELRASGTFSLAWRGELRPYIAGVKRAGWIAIVLPALAALFIWQSILLGVYGAMLHAAVGVACSALMIEVLFVDYRRLPLVSAYVPAQDLRSRGVLYAGAVLAACAIVARIEQAVLGPSPAGLLLVAGVGFGLTGAVAIYGRPAPGQIAVVDLNEEVPLPTQRLNLAG